MDAITGRDRSKTALQMLAAPGERRVIGCGKVEAHHHEQRAQKPFGLAQREMVDKPQGQGGLDGEIRVPPLPARRRPLRRGVQAAIAEGANHTVTSPRRTRAWLYAGQFATRYFVLYVGWTFDSIPVVWPPCSVPRSSGHAAPPAQGLHATTPRADLAGRAKRSH